MKRYDTLIAWAGIVLFAGVMTVFATTILGLDFDASYNLLSYQNLFDGKGFTYTYNGGKTYFDPVISTGPELYLPTYLIWRLLGATDYFAAVYVLLAYYVLFLIFLNFYVLRRQSGKGLATLLFLLLLFFCSTLCFEFSIFNPKGEPLAAMLLFAGFYLLKEKRLTLAGCLLLGLALDVKSNVIVGLLPALAYYFLFDRLVPLLRQQATRSLARQLALIGLCGVVVLGPYLVSSRMVPYLSLEPQQYQMVREQRQARSDYMKERGFGQMLQVVRSNSDTAATFQQLLREKYRAFSGYFGNSDFFAALFLLSVPLLLWWTRRIDHFSFYPLLVSVSFLCWWFTCPLDIWYRYFSLVDFLLIFSFASLAPFLLQRQRRIRLLSFMVLLALLYVPRFDPVSVWHNFTLSRSNRQNQLEMAQRIEDLAGGQIFTDGWFQAPQLMLLTHKRFSDFNDSRKQALARGQFGEIYFLTTIENTIVQDRLDAFAPRLQLVEARGFTTLSKILGNERYDPLVDFSKAIESLLLEGWYDVEGPEQFRFRWTMQEFSLLLPSGTRAIEFYAMLPALEEGQKSLELIVQGEVVGSVLFGPSERDWHVFRMELARPLASACPGTFRVSAPYCPSAAGKSADQRQLGMAIAKIRFFEK